MATPDYRTLLEQKKQQQAAARAQLARKAADLAREHAQLKHEEESTQRADAIAMEGDELAETDAHDDLEKTELDHEEHSIQARIADLQAEMSAGRKRRAEIGEGQVKCGAKRRQIEEQLTKLVLPESDRTTLPRPYQQPDTTRRSEIFMFEDLPGIGLVFHPPTINWQNKQHLNLLVFGWLVTAPSSVLAVGVQLATADRTERSNVQTIATESSGESRALARPTRTGMNTLLAELQPYNIPGRKEDDTPEEPEDEHLRIFNNASNVVHFDGGIYAVSCNHPGCDGVNATQKSGYFAGVEGLLKHFRSTHEDTMASAFGASRPTDAQFLASEMCCRMRLLTAEDKASILGGRLPEWWMMKKNQRRVSSE